MMTVKEIAELTHISARTLHYYDEIGLLEPTAKSEAGYRLYDDKALETLQQILFFREFDIPLKEIKALMNSPVFDRNQILQMQRKMLVAKKERVERMPEQIKDMAVSEFGSIEEWRKHYLGVMASEKMQENYAKVIEWYGSKDAFLEAAGHPVSREVAESFGKRVDSILRKLLEQKELPRDSFEFKEPVAQSYREPLT